MGCGCKANTEQPNVPLKNNNLGTTNLDSVQILKENINFVEDNNSTQKQSTTVTNTSAKSDISVKKSVPSRRRRLYRYRRIRRF